MKKALFAMMCAVMFPAGCSRDREDHRSFPQSRTDMVKNSELNEVFI
jgi:nitrous oxide reductase accessory protein NosL